MNLSDQNEHQVRQNRGLDQHAALQPPLSTRELPGLPSIYLDKVLHVPRPQLALALLPPFIYIYIYLIYLSIQLHTHCTYELPGFQIYVIFFCLIYLSVCWLNRWPFLKKKHRFNLGHLFNFYRSFSFKRTHLIQLVYNCTMYTD